MKIVEERVREILESTISFCDCGKCGGSIKGVEQATQEIMGLIDEKYDDCIQQCQEVAVLRQDIKKLQSENLRFRKVLLLANEVLTRSNNSNNFLGDDEHELWTAVEQALSDKQGEGDGSSESC